MTQDSDVIVIGAGQAGCAAAWDLAAAGRAVTLLQRPLSAAGKPCAGGLTIKAVQRFRFDISPLIRETAKHLHLTLNGWRPVHWPLARPMCVFTHRPELDAFCLLQAEQQGTKRVDIRSLDAIHQDRQAVTVMADGHHYRAPFVIAADGAHSQVRRWLVGGRRPTGAFAIEGRLDRQKASHYPDMRFDFNAVKGGYGWLFPKRDHINVGLYVAHWPGRMPGRMELADYARKVLGSDQLDGVQGYPLGTDGHRLHLSAGRVLFAGDAAGCTEPLLGEGIYGALLSGQLAAQAILQEGDVARTYRSLMSEWCRELWKIRQLCRLFYHTTPLAYGALHHGLRNSLVAGYSAGLTPIQSARLLRGARLPLQ